jgi:serine/threonine protein kinase/Leucine-rich repeat (LRR) protein
MSQCLSESEIVGFVRSAMHPDDHDAAEIHVRECAACAARVEQVRAQVERSAAVHQIPTQLERLSAGDGTSPSDSFESHWTDNDLPIDSGGSAASAAPGISLDEFLQGLSQSGLLPAAELTSVRRRSHDDPAVSTVAGLIDWLVQQHKLTRYQAELLARGQKGGLVLGNYIILDKLGQGGMGTVFKARHRRMNRLVALKVLPQALSNLPEAIARFQREVEAAARLQHPHIAAAYDADEAGGIHFLVMEYVDGPNLANYVKQRGPLPISLAVRLMAQAARGLATAHAQGVVHRDIKPGNIMVSRQGVLKILDMGLAQMRGADNPDLTSDVTQTGRVMGTIDYMAPEQARDAKNVDLRADIYSLGCTLYYLATGRAPAPAGSAAEKLLWHQTQNLPSLSSETPQATPRLDALLAALLAKKPENRPASMHAVAEELEQCLRDLPPADSKLLFDGLDLAADQRSMAPSGSRYGQQTMAGSFGDTVLSDPARRSPLFKPEPTTRSPTALYAGLAGAAALALLVAAGAWWRFSQSAVPVAADGLLLVTVDKGPAEVLVDGQSRGTAGSADNPLELKVKPGVLQVLVQREGFAPFAERVEVSGGERAQVAATLNPVQRVPQSKPLTSPHKPYEKLLAWVFQNRGQIVAVTGGGEPVLLMAGNPVPEQPLEILAIKLDGTGVSDDELTQLAAVPGLRELSLAHTRISDAGIERLLVLRQLASLNLSRTAVTNAGLQTVARLTELTELNLERTAVSDPGMARLTTLPKLERLFLSDTRVTDAGLEQLKHAKTLRTLTAHGTLLTEAGHSVLTSALPELDIAWDGADVERAVALKLLEKGALLAVVDRAGQRHDAVKGAENLPPGRVSIREANLGTNGNFGDADLKSIGVLPEIESLTLAGTRVGPGGLAQLHGLTTLLKIDLGALPLPPSAVEQLQKSLPRCQVLVREQADAEVARQVLAAGGRVSIFTERNALLRDIDLTARLPAGKYSLRAVNLEDASNIDDAALQKIDELQFLESLFLANAAITDAGVERIAACKSLQELSLNGTKVTAAGIATLTTLPRLARLYLARTVLGAEGVRQVGELPALTHLSLRGVTLSDDDLAALKRLQQLEWLDVAGTQLTDAALPHLQKLGKLRELHVTATALSDAAREELIAELGPNCRVVGDPFDPQRLAARWLVEHNATVALDSGQLATVQSLPRGACRVVAVDLAELTQLKRNDIKTHLAACGDIVSLNLSDTQLQEQDLTFLQDMPALRSLRLAKLRLSDKALALLEGHAALEILDLSENRITGQGLSKLAAARGLKQLLMRNTNVSDLHLASLAQFPELEALDLAAGGNLTDAALPSIARLTNLKSLGLRGAKITDAALQELAKLTELERLDLEGTPVGDAGVAQLAGLTKLRHIGLSNTQVTDGVTATLGQMKQLRSLILTRTTVSADSIRQLQTELKGCFISGPALAPRDPAAPAGFGTFDLIDPAAVR